MKLRHIVFLALAIILSCATVSLACTAPPTLTITYSWPMSAYVTIYNSGVPLGDLQTAINNWNYEFNNGLSSSVCNAPQFTFNAGSGQTIFFRYGSVPQQSNPPGGSDALNTTTSVVRGLTDLNNGTYVGTPARLSSVTIYVNSAVTADAAITEVVAHELGHTVALSDCYAPSPCPFHSSVMNSQQPGSGNAQTSVNSTIGLPGPTDCDLYAVTLVATDYTLQCTPPPSPGPPADCSCTEAPTNVCCGSPIIIDTNGQGFYLTSAANGVAFDIFGTGPVKMAWTALGSSNAFLALPASDGLVHNKNQLFGNFTTQPASSTPNGFAALAVYDDPKNGGNGDGVIDARDAVFNSLRLWIDANHDGVSQSDELYTLPSLGVTSISLNYKADKRTDQYGNVFHYRAQVNPDSATQTGRVAYDVFFVVQSTSNTAKRTDPAGSKCSVPNNKVGMLSPVSSLR